MAGSESQPDSGTQSAQESEARKAAPDDDFSVTDHRLHLSSGDITYRATAGRIVVSFEKSRKGVYQGAPAAAEVFLTSYVKTDENGDTDTSRPVVFAFNGGPGSSSVWLHIGLFGPRRVVVNDVQDRTPPPYGLTDNAETLLADADLVFIDPMTTGFTRAAEGESSQDLHGFTGDRDLVGEVIRLWTSRHHRWLSPKFLAGESYGTTRAAALAAHLAQRHGMAINGVMLISAVLDFGTIAFTEGNDAPYVHFLPTYAAIAHYHGKHPGRSLRDVVDEAETFAYTDYATGLSEGSRLPEQRSAELVQRYARLTGLSEEYVGLADLKVDAQSFFAELLRRDRQLVGRLDSRFLGYRGKAVGDVLGDDPSYPVIQYPYTAGINHLLRNELKYTTDLTYEVLSRRVQPWSYKEFENRSVTTAEDLAAAMRTNPDLKVYVAFGYYDSATPFAASEHVLAQLRVSDEHRAGIIRRYYEAGHMMYVHQPSRLAQSQDIADFVAWSIGSGPKPTSDDFGFPHS